MQEAGTAPVERVVSLLVGHYNAFTLASHVQDQLNAMGYGEWTVVYNEPTGQLSITVAGSGLVVRLLGRDPARPNDALEVIGADEVGLAIVNGLRSSCRTTSISWALACFSWRAQILAHITAWGLAASRIIFARSW